MIEEIKKQVVAMSEIDFANFINWLNEESYRRQEIKRLREGKAELLKELREKGLAPTLTKVRAEDLEVGQEVEASDWKSPNGDLLYAYMAGDVIEHNGRLWVSKLDLNEYEPMDENYNFWEKILTEEEIISPELPEPEKKEPEKEKEPVIKEWAPKKTYTKGTKLTYGSKTYEVLKRHISAEGKEPVEVPILYKEITEDGE